MISKSYAFLIIAVVVIALAVGLTLHQKRTMQKYPPLANKGEMVYHTGFQTRVQYGYRNSATSCVVHTFTGEALTTPCYYLKKVEK